VLERIGTMAARTLLRELMQAAPDTGQAREAEASLRRLGAHSP
jgi:hypothetical protein